MYAAYSNRNAPSPAADLLSIPHYLKETAIAMLPIIVIFFLFQFTLLHLDSRNLGKIMIGLLYTYIGLVLFLTGVNIGFSALGAELGAALSSGKSVWWLIPLAMAIGWFIISAEPAVAVLEKQIETVSAGAIPGRVIKRSLSIAIALAMGLSMIRVLTGISLFWFLIPGYTTALILTFFVPDIYTAIAFDSGGVASGPMTATFMLQFFMGASMALGGNVLQDAFGVVALVAMMPLVFIQLVGLFYERKQKRHMHIGVPGHGIVIAVPIKSVGGGKTVAFLNGETDNAAYTPSLNYAHELIVAVCSQGCTDMVMNAARAAGARGGTVLHGKGTGAKGAPKFYNITIAQEKEMILIVAAASQKAAIMQSILKKAGPDSKAGTIVFSLPTTQVAGFALLDNQDET